jgi:hypothetical protein
MGWKNWMIRRNKDKCEAICHAGGSEWVGGMAKLFPFLLVDLKMIFWKANFGYCVPV